MRVKSFHSVIHRLTAMHVAHQEISYKHEDKTEDEERRVSEEIYSSS